MRIHPAILCPIVTVSLFQIASARELSELTDYTNPDTFPMILKVPMVSGTLRDDYHTLPTQIDLKPYFKEVSSPGPILTFYYNRPDDYSDVLTDDHFDFQVWWLDPEPEAESDTDDDLTSDDEDERSLFQNLDLVDSSGCMYLVLNAMGFDGSDFEDAVEPTLPGTIFWRSSFLTTDTEESNPLALEAGVFELADDDTSHVQYGSEAWGTPGYGCDDYTAGTMGLYDTEDSYSLNFNLADNTDYISSGLVATVGKVDDDDLYILKAMAGDSEYGLSTVREVSDTFSYMPLWNTYTDDNFDNYDQPARSDYIQVTSIEMSDPSGSWPTDNIKFLEDQPHDSDEDYDDDDDWDYDDDDEEYIAETDPNSTIKEYFDVSLTSDGILYFTPRDDWEDADETTGTFIFYYRVYVDDGTNDGYNGTDYFRTYATIYLRAPIVLYLGSATTDDDVDYEYDTDGDGETDTTETWTWYENDSLGWLLVYNFPANRWVYSYEHGWIYFCGDNMDTDDGDYWFMQEHYYDVTVDSDDDDSDSDEDDDSDEEEETETHYNPSLGWFWTSMDYYPYLYSYTDEGWVYYLKDENDEDDDDNDYEESILENRLFWSYRQGAYITANGEDTTYAWKTIKVKGKTFGTGLDDTD